MSRGAFFLPYDSNLLQMLMLFSDPATGGVAKFYHKDDGTVRLKLFPDAQSLE